MHKEDIEMKKYVSPEYEIEQFSIDSIITTSVTGTPINGGEDTEIPF